MISLYFSKLLLQPQQAQDRYALHLAVSTAFTGRDLDPTINRVLWRLANRQMLLVQSEKVPDWAHMLEQRFLACPVEVKQEGIRLHSGQRFHFLLDGNPVYRHEGKATAIMDQDGQLSWLKRQFEHSGLRLVDSAVTGYQLLHLPKKANRNLVTVLCCHYAGVLEVNHVEWALDGLRKGIGRAKFAGLGLLDIYPVR